MTRTSIVFILVALMALVSGSFAEENSNKLRRREETASSAEVELSEELPSEDVPSQRRELFTWFNLLFLIHDHGPPCPPHHHNCHDSSGSSGGSSSSSGSDSSSSSSASSSESSTSSTGSGTLEQQNAVMTQNGSWLWLMVAGVAASAALIAAVVGQRKERKTKHKLEGSVKRRQGLFSQFANSSICGAQRPERVVEMTASQDDYRLA